MAIQLKNLIINEKTRHDLELYLKNPTHALMLTGASGVGLGTIAKSLANQLADSNVIYLAPSLHKQQKTAIINAEDISSLSSTLINKTGKMLVVVIDDADQTAPGVFEKMLKLIEEPTANLIFIFTSHCLNKILPTILSRTQVIQVIAPHIDNCQKLLSEIEPRKATQVNFIANGKPALICRLLNSDTDFSKIAKTIESAKEFITGSTNQRLLITENIKDRQEGIKFIEAIYNISIILASKPKSNLSTKQLSKRLDLLATTSDYLVANGNIKIQLLNLALNFS